MTKFVVDASAVLQLASEEIDVPKKHKLLAPTLLRSQTLPALHEAVRSDAVLRRRAWEIADQLGWTSTHDAEYVALTQLQADALITTDAKLARSVKGIVATASIDALR